MDNNQLAGLAIVAIIVSVSSTMMLVNSGAFGATGAAVATGTLSVTVQETVGCTLINSTVAFGSTVDTNVFSGNNTAFVVNNTGNTPLNVSVNSTAATSVFTSSNAVAADIRFKVRSGYSGCNDTSSGIADWTNAATTDKRLGVVGFNEANSTCALDYAIHIPWDEPNQTVTDAAVFFNCTDADDL